MPCILVKTNTEITAEQEKALKEGLGRSIALLPEKSESWLMLHLEDHCRMYFKGEGGEAMAFVEVKVFGSIAPSASEKLTGAICALLEQELGIEPSNTYVKYEESQNWGWNGSNF